ncbi:hypothetical protein [Enterococcus olivae]
MKMGQVVTKGTATKQILLNASLFESLGAQIGDTGVTANSNGRKLIPAGTPVGGSADFLASEQAVLVVSNDENAQGVLMHEVDVTGGTANGTVLIFGFVNEFRIPDVTVTDEAKEALDGKVTFAKRNK